jgi:hypothetical protein
MQIIVRSARHNEKSPQANTGCGLVAVAVADIAAAA